MQVGFIGSGNMASALARGWGDPVLCTDSGSGRAARLVEELGGEAVASNRELVERADLVILAHKPAQLAAVAEELADSADGIVVTILGSTRLADVQALYPKASVFRVEPNVPVAVRKGVLAFAQSEEPQAEAVKALFARLGTVVELPDKLI